MTVRIPRGPQYGRDRAVYGRPTGSSEHERRFLLTIERPPNTDRGRDGASPVSVALLVVQPRRSGRGNGLPAGGAVPPNGAIRINPQRRVRRRRNRVRRGHKARRPARCGRPHTYRRHRTSTCAITHPGQSISQGLHGRRRAHHGRMGIRRARMNRRGSRQRGGKYCTQMRILRPPPRSRRRRSRTPRRRRSALNAHRRGCLQSRGRCARSRHGRCERSASRSPRAAASASAAAASECPCAPAPNAELVKCRVTKRALRRADEGPG